MKLHQSILSLLFVFLLATHTESSYLVLDTDGPMTLASSTQVTSPAGQFYIELSGSYFKLYCSANSAEYYSFGNSDPLNGAYAPYILTLNYYGLLVMTDSIGDTTWTQAGSGFSYQRYQAYIRDNANLEIYAEVNLNNAVWSTNIMVNGQSSVNSAYALCGIACSSSPCTNNGNCTNSGSSFLCACPAGYNGTTCQNNYSGCNSSPCTSGQICTPILGGTYTCACPAGYNGTNCQNNYTGCFSSHCQNSGTCTPILGGTYTCACPAGYNGTNCQNNYTGCFSSPCQNSGTCTAILGGTFNCACLAGYNGTTCEDDYTGCNSSPCQNGGTCTATLGGGFSCACSSQFSGNTCQSEVTTNVCSSNPCQNGGICTVSNGNYSCNCTSAYSGATCSTSQQASNSSNTTTDIIIGCVVGGVLLIIIIGLIAFFIIRSKKNQPKSKSDQEVALTRPSVAPPPSSGRPSSVAASDLAPRSHDDVVAPLPGKVGTMSAIEKQMNDPKYPFDVFISYRQSTDQHSAHIIYLELKNRMIFNRKIQVFFDVMELQTGEDWEQGFLQSLKKAKVFVPVISHAGLEGIRNLVEGKKDNVLYEYEMALAEKESRNLRIIPLLTASLESGGVQWFKDFNENLYPDIFSVTCKTRTVRETMKMIFKLQGIKLIPQAGDIDDGVEKLINEIEGKNNRLSMAS